MILRTAHLFAGAGGGLLADLILGHRPVLAAEWNRNCCDVLRERQREGWLPSDMHIHCGDIRDMDFTPWRGRVDCIAAGFPCQDISCAGKGAGITGTRSGLVSEVFRAIDAIRPGLVFLENSPKIRTRGRDIVIGELVARGYSWRDGRIAAADVGAPHKRERWFCLAANADGQRKLEQERREREQWGWIGDSIAPFTDDSGHRCGSWRTECEGQQRTLQPDGGAEQSSSDTLRHRLQKSVRCGGLGPDVADTIQAAAGYTGAFGWSPPDIGICGMVDGMAYSLVGNPTRRRIEACGNGQVPLQTAAAWIILSGR